MAEITKCLNEWNCIIEALGQSKQSILLRKYQTTLDEFLLYPTVSYANKDNYLNSFKEEYHNFVNDNLLPDGENREYQVKYYAKVEKIVKKSASNPKLNKYHIWTQKHVKSYLGQDSYLWLLRVYKLDKPIATKRSNGMVFANTNKKINLDNIEPVLSDEEFEKIKKELIG